MPKQKPVPAEDVADNITPEQKIFAAVNVSTKEFTLGDRVFPIKDLSYDSYITFVAYLTPLIQVLTDKITGNGTVRVPGIELSASAFSPEKIMTLCSHALPDMVLLMCKESYPEMTLAEVKALAKRPTVLAVAVIKQIKQNEMIKDFMDFFAQVVSVMKTMAPTQTT